MFHFSHTLLYNNFGQTTYVWVKKIFIDKDPTLQFQVRTNNEELIERKKNYLELLGVQA